MPEIINLSNLDQQEARAELAELIENTGKTNRLFGDKWRPFVLHEGSTYTLKSGSTVKLAVSVIGHASKTDAESEFNVYASNTLLSEGAEAAVYNIHRTFRYDTSNPSKLISLSGTDWVVRQPHYGASTTDTILKQEIIRDAENTFSVLKKFMPAKSPVFNVHNNVFKALQVMKKIQGYSLAALIKQGTIQTLLLTQKIKLSIAALNALKKTHEMGYVHSDVKPDNIMVDLSNLDDIQAEMIDLGNAIEIDKTRSTVETATPAYMAPEVYKTFDTESSTQPDPNDQWSDLYSMGLVLAEIFGADREKWHDSIFIRGLEQKHKAMLEEQGLTTKKSNPFDRLPIFYSDKMQHIVYDLNAAGTPLNIKGLIYQMLQENREKRKKYTLNEIILRFEKHLSQESSAISQVWNASLQDKYSGQLFDTSTESTSPTNSLLLTNTTASADEGEMDSPTYTPTDNTSR